MRNKIINTKTLSGGVRLLLISVFCVIVPVVVAQESTPSATVQNKQDESIISTQSGSFELDSATKTALFEQDDKTSGSSAVMLLHPAVKPMERTIYGASEKIEFIIYQTRPDNINVSVTDSEGNETQVRTEKIHIQNESSDNTRITLFPPAIMRSGQYDIHVTQSDGKVISKQSISWGTLALNLPRRQYMQGEEVSMMFEAMDKSGDTLCGASLQVEVTDPEGQKSTLSTVDGTIIQSADCAFHRANNTPNYSASYKPAKTGEYQVRLTQTERMQDGFVSSFTVTKENALTIERFAPSRLFLSKEYEVKLRVTAGQDFEGTVEDALLRNFIYSAGAGLRFADEVKRNDDSLMAKDVLGVSSSVLSLPFKGELPMTLGFGEEEPEEVRAQIQKLGGGLHDGVDFAMAVGTPILSVDEGTILRVVQNDTSYGLTIIVEHSWGKSYYGHLSESKVVEGEKVIQGQEIAVSGNTGISSGPHLHFGIQPTTADMTNGFGGKIDPLTMLPGVTSSSYPAHLLIWKISLKKGESVDIGYRFTATKTSPLFYFLGPASASDKAGNEVAESSYWELPVDKASIDLIAQERPNFTEEKLIQVLSSSGFSIVKTQHRSTGSVNLWVLDRNYGEQWVRIADKTEIGKSSPVKLKNNNVFWISADGNAISAYNTQSKSYFSQTIDSSVEGGEQMSFDDGTMVVNYKAGELAFENKADEVVVEGDDNITENQMFAQDYTLESSRYGAVAGVSTSSASLDE